MNNYFDAITVIRFIICLSSMKSKIMCGMTIEKTVIVPLKK